MSEKIILVTADDVQIGTEDKFRAHRYPVQRHRAISVWLQNGNGEVLFQKRSDKKIVGAGWWANTVCGNVWDGESYEACAVRRLQHELGVHIEEAALHKQIKFEYKSYCNEQYGEHEIDQIFVVHVDEVVLQLNPDEVAETAWVAWDEVCTKVKFLVAEQGYYTAEQSVLASWNELIENMEPLRVTVGQVELLLAPWTVMMIAEDMVSL